MKRKTSQFRSNRVVFSCYSREVLTLPEGVSWHHLKLLLALRALLEDEFGVTGKMKFGTEQGKTKVVLGIL